MTSAAHLSADAPAVATDHADEIRVIGRAADEMAAIIERALHADPAYRRVWLRESARPGRIEIGGYLADASRLQALESFCAEWGGFDLNVDTGSPAHADLVVTQPPGGRWS